MTISQNDTADEDHVMQWKAPKLLVPLTLNILHLSLIKQSEWQTCAKYLFFFFFKATTVTLSLASTLMCLLFSGRFGTLNVTHQNKTKEASSSDLVNPEFSLNLWMDLEALLSNAVSKVQEWTLSSTLNCYRIMGTWTCARKGNMTCGFTDLLWMFWHVSVA